MTDDAGTITFTQETRNPHSQVIVQISSDATLSEAIEAFQSFLIAAGYDPGQIAEALLESRP